MSEGHLILNQARLPFRHGAPVGDHTRPGPGLERALTGGRPRGHDGTMDGQGYLRKGLVETAHLCRGELRRVARIGKRMLMATRTSSTLHGHYERLGRLAAKALEDGTIRWDDPEAAALVKSIGSCRGSLESIEEEVGVIRFSGAAPASDDRGAAPPKP